MDGLAIQAQISKVLQQVQASQRPVSFRVTTRTGGNPVLGTNQVLTVVDTPVIPTPVVEFVKAEEVAGGGGLIQLGDYKITFAGTVPEATFKTSAILFGTEILKILSFEPSVIGGVAAAWQVLARTVKGATS